MPSAQLIANPLSLDDTLEFSRVQIYALENLEKEIVVAFDTNQSIFYPEFADLSKEATLERFEFFRKEVEWNSMLVLLATTESFIRKDYTGKRNVLRKGIYLGAIKTLFVLGIGLRMDVLSHTKFVVMSIQSITFTI